MNTICEICKQYCNGTKGLAIHISKKHKTLQRKKVVKKYDTTPETDKNEEDEQTTDQLDNDENNKFWNHLEHELDAIVLSSEFNMEKTESLVESLISRLKELQNVLPGPKNPNTKYYEMRKSKNFQNVDRNYAQTSNPERKSKRDRQKRKQKHHRDWIQWLYYNQRKKAVRLISDDKDNVCTIELSTIFEKFNERWGTENTKIIVQESIPKDIQNLLDVNFDYHIPVEDFQFAIKTTTSDTAPGPDFIIPRTVKKHSTGLSKILAKLLSIMLKWDYMPTVLKEARTTLLFKKGDKNDVKNWRPITICSIIRRILEKVIDKLLRSYLVVSYTQNGFTNEPGTLLNTSILQAALEKAKAEKKTLYIILLDITQAYDKVGHDQSKMSLQAQPIPTLLRNLTVTLDNGNYTQIKTIKGKTKKIFFKCGLMQGAPTSPQKFNASTKIVLDELNEIQIQESYGFRICEELHPITNLAFADDTGLLANSIESSVYLVSETIKNYGRMGLEINAEKSIAIIIENGEQRFHDLVIDETTTIKALQANEKIKYLGVTFADEIKLDEKAVITELNDYLDKIVSTPLLRPDQKLQIINIYIFPILTYTFQTTPLEKLRKGFLKDIDTIIRHSIKEILQVPDDTPNSMLYSNSSVKGLSLIKVEWESYIQQINAIRLLIKSNNPIVINTRNLDDELNKCLQHLDIPNTFLENGPKSTKLSNMIRDELRHREFNNWCKLKQKGKGVILFKDYPKLNKSLFNKKALTSSEWITYFKMVSNVAAVRAIPGRSTGTNRCRTPFCDEIETLPYVLGKCIQGELLRHIRHNNIVQIFANELKKKSWTVVVEFACVSSDGSNRRIDIIAFNEKSRTGYIIDPTIRFECDENQSILVDEEKKRLYEPCIPDVKEKLKLKSLEVIGLFIGARGTLTKFFLDFCTKFKIKNIIENIGIEAIKGSYKIYNNHIYDPQKAIT